MKRRGSSRRQVLDLNTNASSPKRSWQNKYQQICLDHKNSKGSSTLVAQNGSDKEEKRLPQLVGYTSDSEGEEIKNTDQDIDAKVEDFLKEISVIAPGESSNQEKAPVKSINKDEITNISVKSAKPKTKSMIGPMPMEGDNNTTNKIEENISSQPTIAWQECYDESSGCYYYWNTETNEVTWEIPQELRVYQIALEQWNAQQVLLARQAAGGLVPMYLNQSQTVQHHQKKSSKAVEKTKNKRLKSNSDSEDEKIELITSYGPTSDEEDSGTAPSLKKKKFEPSKSTTKKESKEQITIGPQLPPQYFVEAKVEEPEPKPPGVEDDCQDESGISAVLPVPDIQVALESQTEVDKISTLQRLKTLKNKGSDNSNSEESDSSDLEKKEENCSEDVDNSGEDDDVEDSILERLKNQAKILQELGGEIPEEIKELIEPTTEVIKERTLSPCNTSVAESPSIEINKKTEELKEISVTSKTELSVMTDIAEKNECSDTCKVSEQSKENYTEKSVSKQTINENKLEEIILQEKAPTSFSLIAGYGNEDDSEIEEDKVEDKLKDSGKAKPLFPILGNENEKSQTKSSKLKVIKLSAKAKELIHSSTTTGRARATDFVTTSEGLRPADSLVKENEVEKVDNTGDISEPIKKVSRKKRIEVPIVIKQKEVPIVIKQKEVPQTNTSTLSITTTITEEVNEVVSKALIENPEVVTEPTTTPYASAWSYNSELEGGEHRGFGYGYDYNSDRKSTTKKGIIEFVKADILLPQVVPIVSHHEKEAVKEEIKQEDDSTDLQKEHATGLAQVISEKVKFLSEGKEAVPPVQVMAIQLETLMAALGAGGLSVKYLWEWLTSVDSQLASLEQAAAPQGWQCQWDRSYKRYYYQNDESGVIQWDYPSEQPTQGGEEAMELCDSPPPPPPLTPPPPRISSRSPSPILITGANHPPLPPLPPSPPVISDQPPLPPLPPTETPPPPPLPPSPPPPPPPPIISSVSIHSGEPLPPGVDLPEELYDSSQPPLPVAPPPPPKTPPPPPPPETEPVYSMNYDVTAVPMHYDPYQIQGASDYTGSVYSAESAYSRGEENYVIARPPASNPQPNTACLASELDSFYNEVAALDPPPPPPAPSPSPPPPPSPPSQLQLIEPTKKRKKTKLTPGLALKKKGVSSLVAKWQQVQQDVRREEANEET